MRVFHLGFREFSAWRDLKLGVSGAVVVKTSVEKLKLTHLKMLPFEKKALRLHS